MRSSSPVNTDRLQAALAGSFLGFAVPWLLWPGVDQWDKVVIPFISNLSGKRASPANLRRVALLTSNVKTPDPNVSIAGSQS